jgi:hypothetical protein
MRKMPAIIVVVILLFAVVGYLALDRNEKNVAHERDKSFDAKFAK